MINSLRKLLLRRPVECALVFIASAMTFIFGAYALRFHDLPFGDPSMWGQFGDYAGGLLNPILGSLSLLALAYTVYLQSKTLEATRKQLRMSQSELRNSTYELRRSSAAFDSQNRILRSQAFETTFFNMLSSNRAILESATTAQGRFPSAFDEQKIGHAALREMHRILNGHIERSNNNEATEQDFVGAFENLGNQFLGIYDSYIRNSHMILRFIGTSPLDMRSETERSLYADIFSAQMSQIEIEFVLASAVAFNDSVIINSSKAMRFIDYLLTESKSARAIRDILS
jgi:hypothetical protein